MPGARSVTVAVADLVGFTRLGEVISAEELGRLANKSAHPARDVTAPPLRFVKSIGDTVTFVCPDPVLKNDVKFFRARLTAAMLPDPACMGRPGRLPGACDSVMRGHYAADCIPLVRLFDLVAPGLLRFRKYAVGAPISTVFPGLGNRRR